MTKQIDSFEQTLPPVGATPARAPLSARHSDLGRGVAGIQTSANNSHDGRTTNALDRAASHAHDYTRA